MHIVSGLTCSRGNECKYEHLQKSEQVDERLRLTAAAAKHGAGPLADATTPWGQSGGGGHDGMSLTASATIRGTFGRRSIVRSTNVLNAPRTPGASRVCALSEEMRTGKMKLERTI